MKGECEAAKREPASVRITGPSLKAGVAEGLEFYTAKRGRETLAKTGVFSFST